MQAAEAQFDKCIATRITGRLWFLRTGFRAAGVRPGVWRRQARIGLGLDTWLGWTQVV